MHSIVHLMLHGMTGTSSLNTSRTGR
jgi:hypothetical protein